MRDATEAHVKYMRDAKIGKGVDRHLFGLRMIFEHCGEELGIMNKPKIFLDKGYSASGYWKISTSHCGSSSLSLFGFGPVVVDGFGKTKQKKSKQPSEIIFFFLFCRSWIHD